jgi:uncharacterized cupredoxin-like copper-binding protein
MEGKTMSKNASKKRSMGLYAVAIVVIIIVVGAIAYALSSSATNPSPTPTPSSTPTASPTPTPSSTPTATPLTLYVGSYGFGDSADNIISPGPTLHLSVGQTYTMTVHNVASIPHSWEIVAAKAVGTPMFGAGIDVSNYIPAGQSGSVTFTPDQSGNFYYVCTVPGHIALGMWGNVEIS